MVLTFDVHCAKLQLIIRVGIVVDDVRGSESEDLSHVLELHSISYIVAAFFAEVMLVRC